MSLAAGTRLGGYEIVAPLGAGGMGEVYRAHDRKLNRDVALKILPESFADDADRLARFQREAQVLASLNHPHVGAIYGFHDSGHVHALVLELVEGDTLADRIARGRVPTEEALPIARQIAEALEAAHEHGIVHRDLKPSNIKITPEGVVKVLDFGLAKLAHPETAAGYGEVSPLPTTMSPVLTTGVGILLGTAAYMSPEQAKGQEADRRADIWAFGCVLYEMLTAKRAFDGEDLAAVLASVLRGEPDWAALPADLPMAIVTLLRGCLYKDRRSRVTDIGTATFVLSNAAQLAERVETAGTALRPAAAPLPSIWRRARAMTASIGVGALLASAAVWFLTRPTSPSVVRITVTPSGTTAFVLGPSDRDVAITPDGSRIVYRGANQLLVRALDQLEPTILSGVGAPQGVFISPDGQWVGFVDGTTMKKVPIMGGPPVTVCVIRGNGRGATWSADGTIVFATTLAATGLQRVSASGGEPTVLTKPDRERGEADHVWPEFLPGGEAVLFTITSADSSIENAQIAVLDLQTGTSKLLIRGGSDAHYVSTGHLVYAGMGTLRAVAFDLRRLEVKGMPAPVLEDLVTTSQGNAAFAVAANGSLVYVPGGSGGQTVVSVDRQGRASALPGLPPAAYRDVRVSPDGMRLALATEADVWTYDAARGVLSRLTTDPAQDRNPLWTPDGQRIIFTSMRAGYAELFWRPSDGTGSDERLLARAKDLQDLVANGWSADGKQLLFTEVPPTIQCAIGQIAIDRPSEANVLIKSDFCNQHPAVSPDGRWMAYSSSRSGRSEIYVERYPKLGSRQQISTGGGHRPIWSRDGRELFFSTLDGRQMLVLPVQSAPTLVAGRPEELFDNAMSLMPGNRPYDIAPDGRFVMIRSGHAAAVTTPTNMVLVLNWFEELKRLVPTK